MRQQRPGNGASSAGVGFGLVALAAGLWGTDALFRSEPAAALPAAAVVFAEHLIVVGVGFPFWRRTVAAMRRLSRRDWIAALLIGAGASAGATALFTAAFRYGDPTTPLLLQKTQPLLAVLGARLLLKERLLPHYGIYFVLAVTGAWLVAFPDPTDVRVQQLAPALLGLGAAALWGMGTVLGRGLTARVDTATLTGLRFGIGLPAAALILLVTDGPAGFTAFTASQLPSLAALAIVPGLVSLAVYYRGLGSTPASAATLAELAFPLTALVIGYTVFGNPLSGSQWVGLVVLVGTMTVMGLAANRGTRRIGIQVDGRQGSVAAPT